AVTTSTDRLRHHYLPQRLEDVSLAADRRAVPGPQGPADGNCRFERERVAGSWRHDGRGRAVHPADSHYLHRRAALVRRRYRTHRTEGMTGLSDSNASQGLRFAYSTINWGA